MIKIYSPSDELIIDHVDDRSYRQRDIMGQHNITVYVSKVDALRISLGSYIDFQGVRYTIQRPQNIKKNNNRNLEYTIIFESPQAKLSKFKTRNPVDKRLKFSYTAKPIEHLELIVDNLNMRDNGWTIGECIDAVESVISYNHTSCDEALKSIADTFNTEWEVIGKTIYLRKVEYNKNNPLPLSYGRGNGFKTGITRSNVDSSKPLEVLYTQGGERNIDYSKYGSSELLLPKNQTIGFDGMYFEDQTGFNAKIARYYKTDSEGYSIIRSDKKPKTQEEDSLDCSNIYPSRVGTITGLQVDKKGNYDIFDLTIPENLDFSKYRIDGEKMSVIFQSGMLSGKEFDVMQTDNKVTGYLHSERKFMLVSQEYDGQTMPNETFAPKPKTEEYEGDKYAVFGMMLPDEYICDNTTKSGASWEMLREGVKYFFENEDAKFSFSGQLDGIWAKNDWVNIGGKIILGGYVSFTDNQMIDKIDNESDSILIRITGIKDYLNDPYKPEITLANVTAATYNSEFRKIDENEVVSETQNKNTINYVKRTWRGMMELVNNIYDPSGSFQEDIVSAVALRSMMLALGDPLLQYTFLDSSFTSEIQPHIIYSKENKRIEIPESYVKHNTLGFPTDTLQGKAKTDYLYWQVEPYNSAILSDLSDKFFYLYLKVSKTYIVNEQDLKVGTGIFFLSETKVEFDSDPNNYILWVAFVNSEENEERAISNMFGMAELTPDMLRINNIASIDGQSYIRLLANQFRIGDTKRAIEWNVIEGLLQILNATLEMKNAAGETVAKIDGDTGSAVFAKGNATFSKEGDVNIKGSLETNKEGNKVILSSEKRSLAFVTKEGVNVANLGYYVSGDSDRSWASAELKMQSLDDSGTEGEFELSLNPRALVFERQGQNHFTTITSDRIELGYFQVGVNKNGSIYFNLHGLPTSKEGLNLGSVWINNGVLMVVDGN